MTAKPQWKTDFYDTFCCTADKCDFTCCQQWKISVDESTEQQWRELGWEGDICTKDEQRVICLNSDGNCPHLTENRLCRIVMEHGEEKIPVTCRIFPRQIHEFPDRTEYALAACCPVVTEHFKAGTDSFGGNIEMSEEKPNDFLTEIRNWSVRQMQNPENSPEKNLKMIFFVLLDILSEETQNSRKGRKGFSQGKDRSKDKNGQKDKNIVILEEKQTDLKRLQLRLKDLPELSSAMDQVKQPLKDSLLEITELYLDVVENYRREGMYAELLERTAIKAEQLEKELSDSDDKVLREWTDFEQSQTNRTLLFRNYLSEELFGDFLIPGSTLRDMVIALQWIGMEYAVMKLALFLNWRENRTLTEDQITREIVLYARMTGYDQEDIEEFFENSFDEIFWEWGYFALLLPEESE